MSVQYFDSLDREKQLYDEEVEELGSEVFRKLNMIGVKNWADRQKIAKLLCEGYDLECESAFELAASLKLEDEHIWCYQNTTASLEKYNKYLENKHANYYM